VPIRKGRTNSVISDRLSVIGNIFMKKKDYYQKIAKNHPTCWKRMTKDEINKCPIRKYEGSVHIIRSESELSEAVHCLKKERFLGFDTETRPAFTKGEHYPPALIQLAGETDVFIFQIKHHILFRDLIDIFTDPNIVKAGVAINYDIAELRKVVEFEPAGFVDLGDIAHEFGIQNHGLRGLTAVLLGFRISKGASTSNWENRTLTPAQITYAATDAWVGRKLYIKLQTM